jgi:hypothetical protein
MSHQYTIFIGDDGWRVGSLREGRADILAIEVAPDATLDARLDAAKRLLESAGYTGQPVLVALASPWCLSATILVDKSDRGGRRRARAFQLEEHLPVSAEEVVADYIDLDQGQALGLCVEIARIKAIVLGLEAVGIPVAHLCPTAMLAAAHVAGRHPEVGAVLMGEAGGDVSAACDFLELHDGEPTRWWWLAADDATLHERLAAWAALQTEPAPLAVIGCDAAALAGGDAMANLRCNPLEDVSTWEAATRQAAAILEGAQSPWVDFRRDAMAAPNRFQAYRKPIIVLGVAVVVLLASVCGIAQWRGRQYAALSRQYVAQQADVFKAALPNQRVPGNIKDRLLSEHLKLAPLGGRGAGDASVVASTASSALTQLRDVLAGLPSDVRCRVLDLSLQPDLIRIDGEARSHGEAESLATAMRKSGLYEVESPKTEAIKDRGVSFVFAARPRAGSSTPKADAP